MTVLDDLKNTVIESVDDLVDLVSDMLDANEPEEQVAQAAGELIYKLAEAADDLPSLVLPGPIRFFAKAAVDNPWVDGEEKKGAFLLGQLIVHTVRVARGKIVGNLVTKAVEAGSPEAPVLQAAYDQILGSYQNLP